MRSREVRLAARPAGMPSREDFEIAEVEVPRPRAGEVLVRNHWISVDPYMRGRMRDRKSYAAPYALGEPMTGGAVGRVVESGAEGLAPGDWVLSNYGWREAFTAPAAQLTPLGELAAAPSAYLGVLGMPGMTAYTGLLAAASLKDGETVFISGAAGAVGSVAGQIAKIKKCRVIGSAGSAEKVAWLRELGFDHAFDYHGADLKAELRAAAPERLDVFFDNVGGEHFDVALSHMRELGRIALCGFISEYNEEEAAPGPRNLSGRAISFGLNIRGFLVRHYAHMRGDFQRDMSAWLAEGKVVYRETVVEGIERAPEAFLGLFTGANIGKMVVRLHGAEG
ncbi:MAG TPA: NADP-dependent oxidoreductase [Longimicrobiales bacterium]|nr:NADP-dependent oxidoreductase [Longimicrobiales bacterium]